MKKRICLLNDLLQLAASNAITLNMVSDPSTIWWAAVLSGQFLNRYEELVKFQNDLDTTSPLHLRLLVRVTARKLLRHLCYVRGSYEEQFLVTDEIYRANAFYLGKARVVDAAIEGLSSHIEAPSSQVQLGKLASLNHSFRCWTDLVYGT